MQFMVLRRLVRLGGVDRGVALNSGPYDGFLFYVII